MQHDNIDLVQQVYGAHMSGDRETVTRLLSPDIVWHNSGFDPSAGTYRGRGQVLEYLMGGDHLEDYALEVVDMLASDERAAIVARTSGRRGDRTFVNDFVQVVKIGGGRIVEVWNYSWDQRALVEFMTSTLATAASSADRIPETV